MSIRVRVCTTIEAPPAETWSSIERIQTHVDWMADAESIRFTTETQKGVGTGFECVTAIGPIHLTDIMAITEWEPGAAMGVTHSGIVTGTGRFTLREVDGDRTHFCWDEQLTLPWALGGPMGERFAQPILSRLWRGNLARLKQIIEREGRGSHSLPRPL